MRTLLVLCVLGVVCVLPVAASDPGQPLDCSDWVLLEPGYTCQALDVFADFTKGSNLALDNTGRFLSVEGGPDVEMYNDWYSPMSFLSLRVGDVIVATVQDRVGSGGCSDHMRPTRPYCSTAYQGGPCVGYGLHLGRTVVFDPVNGRALIPVEVYGWSGSRCGYSESKIIAIGGFTTLYDIQQTYTPSAASLSFHVPVMPEGMAAADYFDTYWGDLATVGNWSQAHGLQCHYPATAPARGDYLTAVDTLPSPPPGHGYYYVTAATYQGQTRYGRKTCGARLTGRDPGVLPACIQSKLGD